MAKSLASKAQPVTRAARAQSTSAAPKALRRPARDRFLIPVPSEPPRPLPEARALEALDPQQPRTFELTSPATLSGVFEGFRRSHARLELSIAGQSAAALVIDVRGSDLVVRLDRRVSPGAFSARCDVHDVPFLIRGQLQVSNAAVPRGASGAQPREWHAVLTAPRVYVLDHRRGTRVSLSRGIGTLRWARVVDGVPRIVLSPIVDLAPNGASIRLSATDPSPPSEPFVGELDLGNIRIPLLAKLRRHVEGPATLAGAASSVAGLHFETGSRRRKLVELYMQSRLPGLVPRSNISRDEMTKLLAESGYLQLRAGDDGCSSAWHQYQSESSLDVAYRARDGKAIGHISVTRSYKRTWTLHQLATLGGHAESGVCRRALYDFVSGVPLAFDGEAAYGLAYYNPKRRWHQLFFEMFMQWLNDASLGSIFSFDRFERTGGAALPTLAALPSLAAAPALEPGYEIAPLDDGDLLTAVALIRSQMPPLLAAALNIDPEDLRTSTLNGNQERGRMAYVLRANGTLLGVALCETGPTSASLFNLFNMGQFYVCQGPTGPSVDAQLALLATARRYYAERGVQSPLVVAPAGTFAGAREEGTVLAEAMGCVSISGAGLRQWEHYCRLKMGELYQRKAPSREREVIQYVTANS